jgi:hypothetical protein
MVAMDSVHIANFTPGGNGSIGGENSILNPFGKEWGNLL